MRRAVRGPFRARPPDRGDERAGPQQAPGPRRVARGRQVRVDTGGALHRQCRHPRAERGKEPLGLRHGFVGGVEPVEVAPHHLDRADQGPVGEQHTGADAPGELAVAHAQAEEEAPGELAGQSGVALGGFGGRGRAYGEDAGGDHQRRRRFQDDPGPVEHVHPEHVGQEDRAEAEVLQFGGGRGGPIGAGYAQVAAPHTDPAERRHRGILVPVSRGRISRASEPRCPTCAPAGPRVVPAGGASRVRPQLDPCGGAWALGAGEGSWVEWVVDQVRCASRGRGDAARGSRPRR